LRFEVLIHQTGKAENGIRVGKNLKNMKNLEFNAVEQKATSANIAQLAKATEVAKANIATAASVADVKTEICNIWNQVKQYVIWAENVPVVGKYITILADLLNSICGGA
jgi:hypothetical protein